MTKKITEKHFVIGKNKPYSKREKRIKTERLLAYKKAKDAPKDASFAFIPLFAANIELLSDSPASYVQTHQLYS